MVYFNIVMFLLFQVVANLLFKWGGTAPQRYWWGFIWGNTAGATSILFLIGMFRVLPAATVVAIGSGGSFLLIQIAMYLVYREPVRPAAMLGLALIFAGIMMVALLNHPPAHAEASDGAAGVESENGK